MVFVVDQTKSFQNLKIAGDFDACKSKHGVKRVASIVPSIVNKLY